MLSIELSYLFSINTSNASNFLVGLVALSLVAAEFYYKLGIYKHKIPNITLDKIKNKMAKMKAKNMGISNE